jgi:hypothetical protein
MTLASLYPLGFFMVCGAVTWQVIEVPRYAGPSTQALIREELQPLHDSTALTLKALAGSKPDGTDGLLFRVSKLLEDTNNTVRDLNGTLNIIRHASADERGELSAVNKKTDAAMDALVLTAQHLDGVVVEARDKTLPALTATLTQAATTVADLDATVKKVNAADLAGGVNAAVASARADLDRLGAVLGDASVLATQREIAESGAHIDTATAEFAESMGYIRDRLKPVKLPFWQMVLQQAVPFGLGAVTKAFISTPVNIVGVPTVKTVAGQP